MSVCMSTYEYACMSIPLCVCVHARVCVCVRGRMRVNDLTIFIFSISFFFLLDFNALYSLV